MKYKILSVSLAVSALLILVLSLIKPFKVNAQYYAAGNQSNMISVDKKVRSMTDSYYSDNIESSRKIFQENDLIEFSIAVENIGNNSLNNIKLIDNLPSNLSLIFYPGNFDKTNNTVTLNIDGLNPAEVKTYLIRAKIVDTQALNSNLVQLTNVVEVKNDSVDNKDNASFYVGKGTIPKTGNSALIVQTLLVLGTGTGGFYLRKFVRGY